MDRNKGHSILERIDNFVVIDLETTGLDTNYDEIIEVGAIRVRNGVITNEYQQLIKPRERIDEFIEELTGITNEMVKEAPPVEVVLPDFIEFIGTDIVVGHNVNFDINFIYDSLKRINGANFANDFIDTMRVARRVLPEEKHHRLKDLKKKYGIEVNQEHRSLADCAATLTVYKRLFEDVEDKGINLTEQRNSKHKPGVKASDILAEGAPDYDNPLYGKIVVFTGTLERMLRKDAMQIVANIGGINGDGVTKSTNYLVLGNGDYTCALKDGKSNKHKKAEDLIRKGADLQIISEDVFFDMVEQ